MELFPPTDPPSHPPYQGASQAPVWVWDGQAWVLTPAAGIDAVAAAPTASAARQARSGAANRSPGSRPPARKHPAKRARVVAAGLAATASVGIAIGLAVVSPPSSASNDVNDSIGTSSGVVDPASSATIPTSKSSPSTSGKSTTPSTSRSATPPSTTRSTPSTTQPAPVQRRPTTRSHSS